LNPVLEWSIGITGSIRNKSNKEIRKVAILSNDNIVLSSPIAFTISIITLIILLFMFINNEWLSMGTILVQILFDN